MVPLTREPKPQLLREKEKVWQERYLASCSGANPPRPPAKQYGHGEVRAALRRMSDNKCFYCERKLAEEEDEVDHYVEVAERRDLAFEWTNLYLSCRGCNKKADNRAYPVSGCTDPCDGGQKPADHLSFEAELIVPRDERGRQTIKKYKLDRADLDLRRGRALRAFDQTVKKIQRRMIDDNRKAPTEEEREILLRFGDRSRPFSLMMSVYLASDDAATALLQAGPRQTTKEAKP